LEAALQYLVIVIALVGFWAIVIRPTRKRQRETQDLQADLQVGDRVLMSAGVFGTVRAIEADRLRIEIAPGTIIEAMRQVVIEKQGSDSQASSTQTEIGESKAEDQGR